MMTPRRCSRKAGARRGRTSGSWRSRSKAPGARLRAPGARSPAPYMLVFMAKVRVHSIGVSLDGLAAGPHQDLEHPLGVRGPELMDWFFHTQFWRSMHGQPGGE